MSTPQTNYTPMPPAKKGNAGLVVILVVFGLIIVVGVAAAMFLPKMLKARMDGKSATPAASTETTAPATDQSTQPSSTATAPVATPDATNAGASPAPDNAQPATPAEAPGSASDTLQAMGHAGKTSSAKSSSGGGGKVGQGSATDYGTSAAGAQAAAERAAQLEAEQRELDKLTHEHSLLSTRMASVDTTIETMKQQQAQQGLGMRGDIVAAQQRLHDNMNRLEAALQARDLKAAKQYMELCDRDANTLDKFVGR